MEKQPIPFSILKEDWENSGKEFDNIHTCPATTAFIRQFPQYHTPSMCTHSVMALVNGRVETIAKLTNKFGYYHFKKLSKGIEFHTFITFL